MLRRKHRRLLEDGLVFIVLPLFLLTWLIQLSVLPFRTVVYERTALRLFVDFFGLNEGFAVFAPAVPKFNYQLWGLVTFSDGTVMLWKAPQMEQLSYLDRWRLEGFRKWSVDELLHPNAGPWIYPDACRYIASRCKRVGREPRSVELMEYRTPLRGAGNSQPPERLRPLYYMVLNEKVTL